MKGRDLDSPVRIFTGCRGSLAEVQLMKSHCGQVVISTTGNLSRKNVIQSEAGFLFRK